jgi:hypothetical protein
MIWWLLFVIIVIVVGIRLQRWQVARRGRRIGAIGEKAVALELAKLPRTYHVLNDLMLVKGDGRTAQIDHVVVSPYGIFVIETKFRHGAVEGHANEPKWRQQIGRDRHTFENPLRQNGVHVRTIKEHLPFVKQTALHPLVVFPNETTLHVHGAQHVIHLHQLLYAIRQAQSVLLADGEVQQAVQTLEKHLLIGAKAKRDHVRDIKAHRHS